MDVPRGVPLLGEYTELRRLLAQHMERYPKARFQDLAKLIYQAELGPGHMVTDPGAALKRLRAEWQGCASGGTGPRFEAIGGGYYRAHLWAFTEAQLPRLCDYFIEAAADSTPLQAAGRQSLMTKLGVALDMCRQGRLPISHSRARRWLSQYRDAGMPLISHSEAFRKAYAPAYRVVGEACVKGFDAVQQLFIDEA